jgi:hypothetical protein
LRFIEFAWTSTAPINFYDMHYDDSRKTAFANETAHVQSDNKRWHLSITHTKRRHSYVTDISQHAKSSEYNLYRFMCIDFV